MTDARRRRFDAELVRRFAKLIDESIGLGRVIGRLEIARRLEELAQVIERNQGPRPTQAKARE